MLITKRKQSKINHLPKEVFIRKIFPPGKDETVKPKIFLFGDINWIVQVGIFETTYYYSIEFNQILN